MSSYQRISCKDHSIYELAIMRQQVMKVEIQGELTRIKPIDIATRGGAEFLIFINEQDEKQELRADQIIIQ